MFLPVFDWICLIGTLNCSEHQNKTILGLNQANSVKNTHKSTNNGLSSFGLIEKNMELPHICLGISITQWKEVIMEFGPSQRLEIKD